MMTTTTTDAELDRRVVDHSWMIWTAGALVAIWVSVLVISILAPDLVSGAQQEHLPLAAFTTWLLGRWGDRGRAVDHGQAASRSRCTADLGRLRDRGRRDLGDRGCSRTGPAVV